MSSHPNGKPAAVLTRDSGVGQGGPAESSGGGIWCGPTAMVTGRGPAGPGTFADAAAAALS